jgi:threonine/homoserine/homoserine lactone efflux protein
MREVLRKLWHEITGFLFLCLAMIGAAEVARKWQTHETQKLAAASAFSVMFLYFGVSSFWRARRSQRKGPEAQRKE